MRTLAALLLIALYFTPNAYAEGTPQAQDTFAVVVSAGTPLSISGSATNGVSFESRDGGPGSGYELDARLEWLFAHGNWTFGPTAGFTNQYLRTAALAGNSYTQGSVTVYAPWVGGLVQYDLSEVLGVPLDVAGVLGVGPACVDLHDQITNGTDCSVVRPKARVEVTYRGLDWPVQPGWYFDVSSLFNMNGKGEPGRPDLSDGRLVVATTGMQLRF